VAEREHAYANLDLPLLNRLEKQLLTHADVCGERGLNDVVESLVGWMTTVLDECDTHADAPNVSHYFPGFHSSTVASLVLSQADVSSSKFNSQRFQDELVGRTHIVFVDPLITAATVLEESIANATCFPELTCIADVIKLPATMARLSADDLAKLRALYRKRKADLRHAYESEVVSACREALSLCATPLAVLKSRTLRQACGSVFEDPASGEVTRAQVFDSLASFLRVHLRDVNSSASVSETKRMADGGHACTFTTITTRSPSSHLDVALAAASDSLVDLDEEARGSSVADVAASAADGGGPLTSGTAVGGIAAADDRESTSSGVRHTRLQLADFESERSFQSQVKAFFEAETTLETLLVVQCDPFLTPPLLIDHARYAALPPVPLSLRV
jgi:hypothetical protein